MSFVIAVMKPGYSIVAGDTQLNDDNGPRKETGIKVFPITNNIVIGFTGDYLEGREAIGLFLEQHKAKKDFTGEASLLSKLLKEYCKKGNVLLIETKPEETQYAVTSDDYGWKYDLRKVQQIGIKTLLPNDASEDYCKRYITSEDNLKNQVINCVKAVSIISESVNDKIYGIEMDGKGLKQFTDGIDFSKITLSYDN